MHLIGMFGFVSLGVFGPMFFGGGGQHLRGPSVIVTVTGLVHAFVRCDLRKIRVCAFYTAS